MDTQAIFGLQFLLSLVVFAVIAKWFVSPWMAGKSNRQALTPLLFLHAFRHVGMSFLVPGLVVQPLPGDFAVPAAYGDLISGNIREWPTRRKNRNHHGPENHSTNDRGQN